MLKECTILSSDGKIERVNPKWFAFSERSSVLKRGEKYAIILSVVLRRENGNKRELEEIARQNHSTRRGTQPESRNSLGSIYAYSGKKTFLYRCIAAITKIYAIVLKTFGYNKELLESKRKHLTFVILGATDVEPYVRQWNWYQWQDEKSYELFWKYDKLHRLMFTDSEFEIEIKHNNNFKIP